MYHISENKNIKYFLKKIKFNSKDYEFYNDILTGNIQIDNENFTLLICKVSYKIGFKGTLNDFYEHCINNSNKYIVNIKKNFKKAYFNYNYYFMCIKKYLGFKTKTKDEISYYRLISLLDIDKIFEIFFMSERAITAENFILICKKLLIMFNNNRTQLVHPNN